MALDPDDRGDPTAPATSPPRETEPSCATVGVRARTVVIIMARRSSKPPPTPHPLIGFTQPGPAPGDRLIRVVLDTHSKRWGFFEAPPVVVGADDVDDAPDVPTDLEYPYTDELEALHAAFKVRASAGNLWAIVQDSRSGRWGFHETPRPAHSAEDDTVPDGVQFPFNTPAEATTGALHHLQPYWGDATTTLLIHGGVAVPNMPANARIIHSPGYRAGIDGGLYDLSQPELQAVYAQTHRKIGDHARQGAIQYDIPLGQQVHAFAELWEKQPRRSRPKLHDYLDAMMPGTDKRTRQRHLKVFAVVSSDDWPDMVALAEEEITGMASILRLARRFTKQRPRKTKTPLKQRYLALRDAVLSEKYVEARQLIEQYDAEDYTPWS